MIYKNTLNKKMAKIQSFIIVSWLLAFISGMIFFNGVEAWETKEIILSYFFSFIIITISFMSLEKGVDFIK